MPSLTFVDLVMPRAILIHVLGAVVILMAFSFALAPRLGVRISACPSTFY
jgi:predicted membrane-bound spermidine synthase